MDYMSSYTQSIATTTFTAQTFSIHAFIPLKRNTNVMIVNSFVVLLWLCRIWMDYCGWMYNIWRVWQAKWQYDTLRVSLLLLTKHSGTIKEKNIGLESFWASRTASVRIEKIWNFSKWLMASVIVEYFPYLFQDI